MTEWLGPSDQLTMELPDCVAPCGWSCEVEVGAMRGAAELYGPNSLGCVC